MRRLAKRDKLFLCLIFVVHLVFVVLIGCLVLEKVFYETPYYTGEASLGWMVFLVIDFPASVIVMITSGPGVVGLPWFIGERNHVVGDVIWPGIVFQIIGTVNWFLIYFVVCRNRIWKKNNDGENADTIN